MPSTSFKFTPQLRDEYTQLFATAKLRRERLFVIDAVIDRIMQPTSWAQYKDVAEKTDIPPHVIGIIHSLESGCKFTAHLHNGDPLTARTVQVPAGRPRTGTPPFTWSESAVDALSEAEEVDGWSIAGIAFFLELYNGTGYRRFHPQVKSPYLWSFTTAYSAGKYVADGKWSDTAVSGQCGGMAILRRMIDLGKINLAVPAEDMADEPPPQPQGQAIRVPAAAYPGHLLRRGSSEPAVRTLQDRLLELGIRQIDSADGDFGEKTEWGVRQFQARHEDARGEPLEIDGVVGAKTWASLFDDDGADDETLPAAPVAAGLLDAVLKVARSQLSVREVPRGSNRGPEVDMYLSTVSPSLLGQPWCMAFVYWCFMRPASDLGIANPAPKTASVWRSWEMAAERGSAHIVKAAQARDNPALVKPGMVFYIDTGGRSGHTGFVLDTVDGKLVTLEGNTNNDGSREGYGVFIRTKRRLDSINLGFIDFS